MRRALRTQLQAAGFNVVVFETTESLLDGQFPTDNTCLLLDIYMTLGTTGVEICRKLAAAGKQLPTVLMSACDDELTRRVVNEAEAVAGLSKPFDERALLRAIRKALRKYTNLAH